MRECNNVNLFSGGSLIYEMSQLRRMEYRLSAQVQRLWYAA